MYPFITKTITDVDRIVGTLMIKKEILITFVLKRKSDLIFLFYLHKHYGTLPQYFVWLILIKI